MIIGIYPPEKRTIIYVNYVVHLLVERDMQQIQRNIENNNEINKNE